MTNFRGISRWVSRSGRCHRAPAGALLPSPGSRCGVRGWGPILTPPEWGAVLCRAPVPARARLPLSPGSVRGCWTPPSGVLSCPFPRNSGVRGTPKPLPCPEPGQGHWAVVKSPHPPPPLPPRPPFPLLILLLLSRTPTSPGLRVLGAQGVLSGCSLGVPRGFRGSGDTPRARALGQGSVGAGLARPRVRARAGAAVTQAGMCWQDTAFLSQHCHGPAPAPGTAPQP